MTDYSSMIQQLQALVSDVPYATSNLANASALLYHTMSEINWAGFYLMNNGVLVLGPFQGKTACIEIGIGRGVCGTAVKEGRTLVVGDVHSFPGHIACDSDSRSEIVIPIRKGGRIVGVLDVDSPICDRFSSEDKKGLEEFVAVIEKMLEKFDINLL